MFREGDLIVLIDAEDDKYPSVYNVVKIDVRLREFASYVLREPGSAELQYVLDIRYVGHSENGRLVPLEGWENSQIFSGILADRFVLFAEKKRLKRNLLEWF